VDYTKSTSYSVEEHQQYTLSHGISKVLTRLAEMAICLPFVVKYPVQVPSGATIIPMDIFLVSFFSFSFQTSEWNLEISHNPFLPGSFQLLYITISHFVYAK
jgi:hypothetical protein